MAITLEQSDACGRAAEALEKLQDPHLAEARGPQPVEEMLGEKLILNMGPSHPSTHGVLRIELELDGETITRATPHIGYLHRGFEKIAENMQYNQFTPYTDRLDYLSPIANNVAYSLAVEKLLGWEMPPRGKAIRVVCCELARISSHLVGIGCTGMDVGATTLFLYGFTEREKIHNLLEALTGARFTTTYTRVGGHRNDLPAGFLDALNEFLRTFKPAFEEMDKLITRNRIFMDRMVDVGVITREDALGYGLTGPNLRASGVERDLRRLRPYLDYNKYEFDIPVGKTGDAYDRFLVRMEEVRESVRILEQVVKKMPAGPANYEDPKQKLPSKTEVLRDMEALIHHFMLVTEGVNAPPGEIYFGAENPKGELGFYIHSKGGGVPYRLKIRGPSFANLSILPKILPGHLIADAAAILASLDFVMGECDR